MPLEYFREVFDRDKLQSVEDMVKCHLSAMASANDNPYEFYDEVKVSRISREDGSLRIFGTLDREAQYDYSLPDDYTPPDISEYQQGFGERIMDEEELNEHLLRKEKLGRDFQFQRFKLTHLQFGDTAEGVRFSDGSVSVRWLMDVQYTMNFDSTAMLMNYAGNPEGEENDLQVEWL